MFNSLWQFVKSAGFMAVVALVSFGVAIYASFYYEKQGQISVELTQPTKVLDIHEAVGGLSISYDGEELRTAKKNLWLINTTIKNTGNAVIRKGDFDDSSLLTLKISGGEVVEKPTLITDSTYLKDNVKPKVINDTIVFNPIIIEPDEKFLVSFFVLGSEKLSPVISLAGKVAGVKGFNVLEMSDDTKSQSIWNELFTTSKWWHQIIRAFAYAFLCLILMALLVMSLSIPGEFFSKRSKSKVESLRRIEADEYKPEEDISIQRKALLDFYVGGGVGKLESVDACFKIANDRKKLFLKLKNYGVNEDEKLTRAIINALCSLNYRLEKTYEEMCKKKLILGDYEIDPISLDEFEQICKYFNIDLNEYRKRMFFERRAKNYGMTHRDEVIMRQLTDTREK